MSKEEVRNMLESAAEKGGVAVLPQWRIAGKTGTAQIPDFIHGGYTESYVHTFIGMAPVSDPQFVILVKIDKPNAEVAALTVVPAFRDLAQFTLSYFNVTPDKIQTNTKTNQ
jgi:cell division protein FtsI/penicillin-binding protein 2